MVGQSDPPSLAAPITRRHDKFYLTDEMAVFQVCDYPMLCQPVGLLIVIDRPLVPLFVCRSRTVFFAFPSAFFPSTPLSSNPCSLSRGDCDGEEIEGKSKANPIYLSSVTVLEFETLLQYLLKG